MNNKKSDSLKLLSSKLRDAYTICNEIRFMDSGRITESEASHALNRVPLPPDLSKTSSIAESREEILKWGKEARSFLEQEQGAEGSALRAENLENELEQIANVIKLLASRLLAIEMKYF